MDHGLLNLPSSDHKMSEIVYQDVTGLVSSIESQLQEIAVLASQNQFTFRQDQTQGSLLSSVQGAINDFLNAVKTSNTTFNNKQVAPGNINPSIAYNAFWSAINNDLNNIYSGADGLGSILQDHYNYVSAYIQNLLLKIKQVQQMVNTYELFATTAADNETILTDNFTTTSQLALNSTLLSAPQCNIDTSSGEVTLSINNTTIFDKNFINSITLGTNSNGSNNSSTQLIDIMGSTSLQQLFQYTLTNSNAVTQTLTLDFTIQLKTPQILNFIRIVPNNYGTLNWPTITALDVSLDGINRTSIKDLLLSSIATSTNFQLSPTAGSFSGEGRYNFLPVKAQYIHFTIQQTNPYFDIRSNLYTWAIGIKDIELTKNQYNQTSQLISSVFTIPAGISEITLNADILPDNLYNSTELPSQASALFDISIDGGMTWYPIAPTFFRMQDPTISAILNINNIASQTNPNIAGSINTNTNATNLIYRIRMNQLNTNITDSLLLPYYSPVVTNLTIAVIQQEILRITGI